MGARTLRRRLAAAAGVASASIVLCGLQSVPAAAAAPVTFNTPGVEGQYTVPNQAGTLQVLAVGAGGGPGASSANNTGGSPGRGGILNITLQVGGPGNVVPGGILYVEVGGTGVAGISGGGGGSNGGGSAGTIGGSRGGGGGGSSDIRTCSNTTPNFTCPGNLASTQTRLVVAAGAGGGAGAGVLSGAAGQNANGGNGGDANVGPGPLGGGGTNGGPTVASGLPSGGTNGGGATDIAPAGGGSIGANTNLNCTGDTSGASGDRLGDPNVTTVVHGGAGGNGSVPSGGATCPSGGTGGGGGGGYQGGGGGGGGGSGTTSSGGGGGAGAGSSFPDVGNGATYAVNTTGLPPEVVLTFNPTAPSPSPTATPVPTQTPVPTATPDAGAPVASTAPSSTPFTAGPGAPVGGFLLAALAGLVLMAAGGTVALRSQSRAEDRTDRGAPGDGPGRTG
jgi:hypothetical protein